MPVKIVVCFNRTHSVEDLVQGVAHGVPFLFQGIVVSAQIVGTSQTIFVTN